MSTEQFHTSPREIKKDTDQEPPLLPEVETIEEILAEILPELPPIHPTDTKVELNKTNPTQPDKTQTLRRLSESH